MVGTPRTPWCRVRVAPGRGLSRRDSGDGRWVGWRKTSRKARRCRTSLMGAGTVGASRGLSRIWKTQGERGGARSCAVDCRVGKSRRHGRRGADGGCLSALNAAPSCEEDEGGCRCLDRQVTTRRQRSQFRCRSLQRRDEVGLGGAPRASGRSRRVVRDGTTSRGVA